MNICVPIKRVIDYRVVPQLQSDGSGVLTTGVKHSMNPFDEIALEQAIRTRESGQATQVIVLAVGNADSDEVLRAALAIGADQAVRIHHESVPSPMRFARLLAAWLERHPCGCVMLGKQAIDDDCNQVGQLLAGLLNWPQATFASSVSFLENTSQVEVVREIDGGLETLRCQLPAVITADLRLAEPRLPTLPAIMASKGKSITLLDAGELGVSQQESLQVSGYRIAPPRIGGGQANHLSELLEQLEQAGCGA